MGFKSINKKQFYLGLITLVFGIIFYISIRPNRSSYLQNKLIIIDIYFNNFSKRLVELSGSLPEFIHPFAFSLICMGLIAKTIKSRLWICLIFFSINIFFEIGQKYANIAIKFVPNWFNNYFILENTKNYFLKGTFSILDIIAIFLGAMMAFFIGEITSKKDIMNEE